jgi:mycoredoxin
MTERFDMEKKVQNDEIVLYGTRWCYDCLKSVKVLKRQGVPYRWIDIDTDPEGYEFVKTVNGGMKSVPTILFPDGDMLVEPSNDELVEKLKLIFS